MKLTRKQLSDREDRHLELAKAASDKARNASMLNPPRWTSVHYWQRAESHHREKAWRYCQRIAALYQGI